MPANRQQARDLFLHVVGKLPPELWDDYVAEACVGDAELARQAAQLLQAHRDAGSFLDRPAAAIGATGAFAPTPSDVNATALPREGPGTLIGPYRLLEQIGEGGFGVVFMAEQSSPLRRKVALKVLKPGMDTRQVVARFEAERQALALMDHHNIAKVFDGGETASGRPYFVMELVRGIPITDFCDRNRLSVRDRLGLFAQVCRAVQHAHQKGVIHRDVKPTNVLVTLHDDTAVPKVIDFGIAKAVGQPLTEKTLFTNFAQMIGTPLYMSPEQAQLSGLDVDTRSDIYSLGVLLYELLTGTTPFDKERLRTAGYDEIRRIIREEEPARPSTRMSTLGRASAVVSANRGSEPRKLSALFRGELDWIVMRALEKDRNRRYETASAFAADVERYLDDEPVQACPPSLRYQLRKFAWRNRRTVVTATAAALAVVLGVAGLAVSTVLIARALRSETEAKGQLADTLEREQQDAYFHRIALAHRELSRDNLRRAMEQLDKCPEKLRQWEWRYLTRLCRVEPVVLRDTAEVNSLAFSPGGEWIASAGGDGVVRVRNGKTGETVRDFPAHTGSVYSVAFHPDGKHLASAGADKQVKVWDWTTGLAVFTDRCAADHDRGVAYCLAFSPDGRRLAVGSDGAVNVWDWAGHRPLLAPLGGHAKKGISVAFSPDGRRLASASWSGDVMIWDAETGARLHTLSDHRHPVSALAFSPDGRRLVSASFDRRLIVWDAATGQNLHSLEGHDGLVLGAAFSPDGSRIASTGEDKTVRVWDVATGREVLDIRGHTELCQGVAFSPRDGLRLASAGSDGTIRFWDATPLQGNEAQEALSVGPHSSEVWTVAVSPDREGRWVASAGHGVDAPVRVWDARSGRVSVEYTGHGAVVFSVAWHPDGRWIASSGWDAERKVFVVKVWNARTRELGFELPVGIETFAVAFSPDGKYLVTGKADGTVQVWDAKTGGQLGKLGTHGRHVRGLVFSRDGRQLASASGDGEIKVWDWDATRPGDGQTPRRTFRGVRVPLAAMTFAFSPDGRRLVAGGEENTVKVWDLQTDRVQTLWGHSGDVWATAVSPDREGRWVASAGEDSTVKVWDSQSGELVHSFRGHTGLVSSLAFTPDGERLVSGSRDKTVKVWDVTKLGVVVGDR